MIEHGLTRRQLLTGAATGLLAAKSFAAVDAPAVREYRAAREWSIARSAEATSSFRSSHRLPHRWPVWSPVGSEPGRAGRGAIGCSDTHSTLAITSWPCTRGSTHVSISARCLICLASLRVTLALFVSWSVQAIHSSTTCWRLQKAAKRSTRHGDYFIGLREIRLLSEHKRSTGRSRGLKVINSFRAGDGARTRDVHLGNLASASHRLRSRHTSFLASG